MDDGNGSLILLNESQFSYLEKILIVTDAAVTDNSIADNVNDESIVVGINPDLTLNESSAIVAAAALDGEADNVQSNQDESVKAGKCPF